MLKKLKTAGALFCLVIGISAAAAAQPMADHVALYVKELKKSADFYENVMQLPVISEPFHDGKHIWLRTGEHSQLHLIQGAADIVDHDINSHFAYHVPDLAVFTKHLDEMGVKYGNWKQDSKSPQLRPDGVKQVYLQDPDKVWIEVNDDKF